jgi:hypothetical protein
MVKKLVHFFTHGSKAARRGLVTALALGLATAGLVACAETSEGPAPEVSSEVEAAIDDAQGGDHDVHSAVGADSDALDQDCVRHCHGATAIYDWCPYGHFYVGSCTGSLTCLNGGCRPN